MSWPVFKNLLDKMFSAFLFHKCVPEAMIKVKIKPVIKNVFSIKSDSTNCRPVMISANLLNEGLKVFEYCLTPTLTKHL